MSWIRRYKLKHYFRNAIWIVPAFGLVAGLVMANGLHWVEQRMAVKSAFDPAGALALFGTLAGSMFTFIVFLSSSLLLVLQLSSAQLSPRIIGVVFQDGVTRTALTLFTFTFTFTLAVLLRIQDTVPPITAQFAGYCCLLSAGMFLFLIDHLGKLLRPSGALLAVARRGREVIRDVYPRPILGGQEIAPGLPDFRAAESVHTVMSPRDGVLLAFDLTGLVALARENACVIELVPQVGDFVAAQTPLFRVIGATRTVSDRALCQSLALGQERTMEQDPAFAFRIMVDIASKALSPAINDPTTAVLALDQIHYLLRSVGSRHLDEGVIRDEAGAPRLIYPTPAWVDFVHLAVTEVRQFGGTSIQVVRRLRAMLASLAEILPPERAALLHREMALLQRTTERLFIEPEDQAMAGISDSQGMGGKHVPGHNAAPAAPITTAPAIDRQNRPAR